MYLSNFKFSISFAILSECLNEVWTGKETKYKADEGSDESRKKRKSKRSKRNKKGEDSNSDDSDDSDDSDGESQSDIGNKDEL